jgi:hypothetical protein
MTTARDRRKKIITQIMLFVHKKSKKIKNNQKLISLNQYFPHFPYAASKKGKIINLFSFAQKFFQRWTNLIALL